MLEAINPTHPSLKVGRTLLMFSASWCQPCKSMVPVVTKTSEKFPGVKFGKMTIDDPNCTDYADGFGITNVPTFVLMENGKVLDKRSGTMTETQLDNFLDF